jgi:DNA sulfur modification protein DndC
MAFNYHQLKNEIKEQYLEDDGNRPWIVAFSGGKDSTMLLQVLWYALQEFPPELLTRPIYVICNNTLVENPHILEFVDRQLKAIAKSSVDQGLPIVVDQTTPRLEDSFWVNLIGKGYPAPNSMFRWCTERLKIRPTTLYIQDKISEHGEVIILIGTRSDESAARARSIAKHQVNGSRLRNHSLPNAKAFAPIKDVTTQEVWTYLQAVKCPWTGDKNRELITLYRDGSGGDCPLVMDIKTPSCGNSRFGCWVCTVVSRDKSMEALVDNGEKWMRPLAKIRDYMAKTIERKEGVEYEFEKWRMPVRRGGQEGSGPYWPKIRLKILRDVLEAQKLIQEEQPNMELITYQELVAIQVQWHRDFIFDYSVSEAFKEVFGTRVGLQTDEKNEFESSLLRRVFKDAPEQGQLVQQMLQIHSERSMMAKRVNLKSDLEALVDEFCLPKITKHYSDEN